MVVNFSYVVERGKTRMRRVLLKEILDHLGVVMADLGQVPEAGSVLEPRLALGEWQCGPWRAYSQ